MSDERHSSSGFSWFLAGLGLGALIGVLYAPKSGRETREDLITGAKEGTDYLKQRSKEAAEQVSTLVDRGKAQAAEIVDRGKEAVDRGRAQWEEFISHGKQFVSQQGEKVVAAVDAGKQAYQSTAAGSNNANP
jgi:gas vesicle protein